MQIVNSFMWAQAISIPPVTLHFRLPQVDDVSAATPAPREFQETPRGLQSDQTTGPK
jgi:hypothetical protein